ncbi:histidine ammonia-lyase [Streptomyces tsukubensis]|uniref:Histidine ammonia-lyase n=1 Tax=Streptomyces tsukubensis TaxID=83656 RepID=A0A1V4A3H4_9ACTN|nr:histidine ammonia-lyase [Streptomyces tsukubensis]
MALAHLKTAAEPVDIRVSAEVLDRVAACHTFARRHIDAGNAVYGASTGFGPLVDFRGRDETQQQAENALAHLGAGQGPNLDAPLVRATMLARLSVLCQGRSGVSTGVVQALAAALGSSFAPAVPSTGSLGASGDLIPLSYVARALKGDGEAYADGTLMPAARALAHCGLTPLELDEREALALVNGTSLTAAAVGLATLSVARSLTVSVLLTALLCDTLGCSTEFASPALLRLYAHPDAERVGAGLRGQLEGIRPDDGRSLQEPYSVRCSPQLIGAVGSTIAYADRVTHDSLNSVTDNPVFFVEDESVIHGGNFFGQSLAFAGDLLSVGSAQLGNLAERQLDALVDPRRNGGRPPMLSPAPGQQHALQGVQLAATAMVVEMRRDTVPASAQSLPTNWHNQDVVPLGTHAALTALRQATSLRLLHGSLAVALRQAVHVGERELTAPACVRLYERLADVVDQVDTDRPLGHDVRMAADLLDRIVDEDDGLTSR